MLLGLPDDIHEEKHSFLQFKKKRITDRRTDRPSYRDARTHLKILGLHAYGIRFRRTGKVSQFHCRLHKDERELIFQPLQLIHETDP